MQDYRPGLSRADVEDAQRAQRRADGRPEEAATPRHAEHARTFDGPPPRGSAPAGGPHCCSCRAETCGFEFEIGAIPVGLSARHGRSSLQRSAAAGGTLLRWQAEIQADALFGVSSRTEDWPPIAAVRLRASCRS